MSCFITKTEILYFFLDLLCSKFPLAYSLVPATCVLFQTIRSTKALLADGTCVRLLVRVNTLVDFQSTRLTKSFIAHITLVRLLVRVNTHVLLQITRITKSFITNITFIRLLVRVNTHVGFQTTRLSETLLANITLVRFLVRVNTLWLSFCVTLLAHIASYGFSFVCVRMWVCK